MKKILFVTNLASKIGTFSLSSVFAARSVGIEFHMAANWRNPNGDDISRSEAEYNIKIKNVPISRNPLAKSNIAAYKELVEYVNNEKIDYIHCNTPTGGMLGRLIGKKCNVKKVIYQAHGFHFYKGAPKKNWLIYYPVEKLLAHYTDAIITINQEDYELAKSEFKLKNHGKVFYVPGVGIDTTQYVSEMDCCVEKRSELGIPLDAFVIISVGELNTNKNNSVIISSMEKIKEKNIHYILCGVGDKQKELQEQVDKAGLNDRVHFLGYRNDVKELYKISNCFVMPSFREGLSRSLMEAMASGLPCIVSRIRGNVDLIEDGKGGFLVSKSDVEGYAEALKKMYENPDLCEKMSRFNLQYIKNFDIEIVKRDIIGIYKEVLLEKDKNEKA